MITCSDLLWPLKSSNTVTHALFIGCSLAQTQCSIWVLAVSADEITSISICQGTCDCTPQRISTLNKMVPSSSLCFDKDIKWQAMSGVHSLFAKLMPVPWGPATSPGQARSCHFILDFCTETGQQPRREKQDDKAYSKFKVGTSWSKSIN